MTRSNLPVGLGVRCDSTLRSSRIDVGAGAAALPAAPREVGTFEWTLCTQLRIVDSTAGAQEGAPFDGQSFGAIGSLMSNHELEPTGMSASDLSMRPRVVDHRRLPVAQL